MFHWFLLSLKLKASGGGWGPSPSVPPPPYPKCYCQQYQIFKSKINKCIVEGHNVSILVKKWHFTFSLCTFDNNELQSNIDCDQ